MIFNNAVPAQDAMDFINNKVIVPGPLTSSEWKDVPVELRQRGFFSSQVENAQFLQNARDQIQDFLKNNRDANGALKTGGRADFVNKMQKWLTENGVSRGAGGLTDITSQRRLGLIFNTMIAQAYGYANYRASMDPDVLNEFPAWRFIRVFAVKEPRLDHARYQGKMFLKTDPIWNLKINQDFGVPWGPWGWGCGHDVEDVDRDEAEAEGLLGPDDVLEPDTKFRFNKGLQASVKRMDPDLVAKLKAVFGDRITIDGDSIKWAQAGPANVAAPPVRTVQPAAPVPTPAKLPAPSQFPAPVPAPAVPKPTAAGAPAVSDAITVAVRGGLADQVNLALRAIDVVHDDGVLPEIDVESSTQSSFGFFRFSMNGNLASARVIGIRGTGDWPALTTAHEIGHFLDLEGIGVKGTFATLRGDGGMAQVLAAAEKTDAIQGLRAQLAATNSFQNRRHLEYLLKPQEIWARAYAQFIAGRSGMPALSNQLELAMKEEKLRQWDVDDFEPLADAIETMFRAFGWI